MRSQVSVFPQGHKPFVLQRSPVNERSTRLVVLPQQTDVSSRFGLRLRNLRRERNLTQERMAMKFGIDRSYISDVERGKKAISLPMLEILSLGLQVTLSDLLADL
jgi:DNA-binding XRE family transcriptional regulator